jgi:hypothetical protein
MRKWVRIIMTIALAYCRVDATPGRANGRQHADAEFVTTTGQTLSLTARPVVVYRNGRANWNVSGSVSLSTTRFKWVAVAGLPADSCMMSLATPPGQRPDFDPARPILWSVASRLRSWTGEEATLDVRIERQDTIGVVHRGPDIPAHRLILREGERRVIDMVSVSGRDCEAVQLEVALLIGEPEAVRHAALSYDIWLVHHEADGTDRSARFRTAGLQGQDVPFAFAPLAHNVDGTPNLSGHGGVQTAIAGRIRGRARPDGRLDLTVAAQRLVTAGAIGQGDGGAKRITVDQDETVELALPGLEGSLPGVNLQQFLAGQSTAVRVTARRVR